MFEWLSNKKFQDVYATSVEYWQIFFIFVMTILNWEEQESILWSTLPLSLFSWPTDFSKKLSYWICGIFIPANTLYSMVSWHKSLRTIVLTCFTMILRTNLFLKQMILISSRCTDGHSMATQYTSCFYQCILGTHKSAWQQSHWYQMLSGWKCLPKHSSQETVESEAFSLDVNKLLSGKKSH